MLATRIAAHAVSNWESETEDWTCTPSDRDDERDRAAEGKAGERLLEREPAGAPEEAALVPERAYDRREAREQEALDVEDVRDQPLPRRDPEPEDGDRRDPVLRAAADAA